MLRRMEGQNLDSDIVGDGLGQRCGVRSLIRHTDWPYDSKPLHDSVGASSYRASGKHKLYWTETSSATMCESFKADLHQYFVSIDSHSKSAALAAFFEMSLWAIAIFRLGKWAHGFRLAVVRWPLMAIYFFLYKLSQAVSGIRISLDSEVGPGLVIHNFGGVIIHGRVGKNCIFVQGAQMMSRADGKARGWPTLGDGVYVGAGAKILGDVVVGDHARIGVNSVVMTDVPAGAVVMPPESRVILASCPGRDPTVARDEPSSLRDRIVLLLKETTLQGRPLSVGDSESLLENGLIDSLGILALADSLSTKFRFVVEQDELMPENLDSVEAIVCYVRRKGIAD
jgi:serine O-acetyltransferase